MSLPDQSSADPIYQGRIPSSKVKPIELNGIPDHFMAVARDGEGTGYLNFSFPSVSEEQARFLGTTVPEANKKYAEIFTNLYHPLLGENPTLHLQSDGEKFYASAPMPGMNFKDVTPDNFGFSISSVSENTPKAAAEFHTKMYHLQDEISDVSGRLGPVIHTKRTLFSPAAGASSLEECLSRQAKAAEFSGLANKRSIDFLRDKLQASDLLGIAEARLAEKNIKEFSFGGYGRSGVFFKGRHPNGENVIIAIRKAKDAPKRAQIPHAIHSLAEFEHDGFHVEVTPGLNAYINDRDAIQSLYAGVDAYNAQAKTDFKIWDTDFRNFGANEKTGTLYYLDGDGISYSNINPHPDAANYRNNPWVDKDGIATQYHEFHDLHADWNSPLHQAGGKIGNGVIVDSPNNQTLLNATVDNSSPKNVIEKPAHVREPLMEAEIRPSLEEAIHIAGAETPHAATSLPPATHLIEETLSKSREWSRAGKWTAGVAAAAVIAGGGWTLYEHSRRNEKSADSNSSISP